MVFRPNRPVIDIPPVPKGAVQYLYAHSVTSPLSSFSWMMSRTKSRSLGVSTDRVCASTGIIRNFFPCSMKRSSLISSIRSTGPLRLSQQKSAALPWSRPAPQDVYNSQNCVLALGCGMGLLDHKQSVPLLIGHHLDIRVVYHLHRVVDLRHQVGGKKASPSPGITCSTRPGSMRGSSPLTHR